MKIALLGYGKMGQLIETLALKNNDIIVAKCTTSPDSFLKQIKSIEQADVCIDFSHASCVLENIKACLELEKPIVVGTTGWEKDLPLVKQWVENSNTSCLYAPNFSLGVQLFMKIVSEAARLLNPFSEYDIGAFEAHHKHKADAPSGTAKALFSLLNQSYPTLSPDIFTSLRCGSIPGTHTICFDSPADTITLSHAARNREGFASGALRAAEWLQNKKGFFTLENLIDAQLKG